MGREIYNIINDMAEVLNASQMQKLQEVLVNQLSENHICDYMQTSNDEFLDMFLTAKHLEGCSDKTIRYYRCNIEKMLETIEIPVVKITTEMLRKYLVVYQSKNNCGKVITNPEDKRSKLLALTKYTECKRDEFIALADSVEKEMTDGLSELEAEVLSDLLLKVIEKHNNEVNNE